MTSFALYFDIKTFEFYLLFVVNKFFISLVVHFSSLLPYLVLVHLFLWALIKL